MKEAFKCCWNCHYGCLKLVFSDGNSNDKSSVSERYCVSLREILQHPGSLGPSKNPFIFRNCPDFLSSPSQINFGHEISETEANRLNTMTTDELLEYWWNTLHA